MEAKDADHVFLVTWDFRPQASLIAVYKTTGERTGDLVAPLPTSHPVLMTGNGGRVVRIADGVYYAFSYPYRIERFDNSGALQRVITRKHEAFVAPEAPKAVGGSIIGADLPNRISGLGVASNGIVVVQIQMEDKPNELDFFSPEGKFLQSISLPDEHRLGAVIGNTLYTYVGGTDEQFASVTKWNLEIN